MASYSMGWTQAPVVYTGGTAWSMTVEAGYYDEKKQYQRDGFISAAKDGLYLAPMPGQAAAVLDFLTKNAASLPKNLEWFASDQVTGHQAGRPVSDFVSGVSQGFEAKFVNEPDLWVRGKPEIRYLVVSSRPGHLRKVKFEEVAFIRPVSTPAARGTLGAARKTLLEMDGVLGTL
jgi:hypothetical protein